MSDHVKKQALLKATRRMHAVRVAQDKMLPYLKLLMPDPGDPDDINRSRYITTPLARILCEIVERIDRGELKRVAISVGPQFGKSQIISRAAPAWLSGRDRYRNLMLGSYNQDFANDFGAEVRDIVKSKAHQQVFPDHILKSEAVYHQMTREGGQSNFVGVGGSGTGKPADIFVVDDPIRNDEDAQSEPFRNKLWKWFNGVVFSRLHDGSAIVVVHTRWHQDDLIGRLCDPDHPERHGIYAGIADNWTHINLPAVVRDPSLAEALNLTLETQNDPLVKEQFGTEPMSSLWPGRKSLPLLAEAKRQDPRIFGALYMGEPSPEDGDYFTTDMLQEYGPGDLPPKEKLRFYGASDHAVSMKQRADKTVAGCVAVDDKHNIFVLSDVAWRKMETDKTIEVLLEQMTRHKPMLWWIENELISKSFGPFLRMEMRKRGVYVRLDPNTPSKDKVTRARAIQGYASAGKVFFPRHASWWSAAKAQMLKFPYGTNDDFVDFMAHIGLGLNKIIKPASPFAANDDEPPTGSIQWILRRSAQGKAKTDKIALYKRAING